MKAVSQARKSSPGFMGKPSFGCATGAPDFGAGSCFGPGERPVDLVHLSKYTLGDAALEAELLGLFRTQAALYCDRLGQVADPEDWPAVVHTLKGSARAIGAWALGDMAARVETLSEAPARAEALKALRDGVAEVNRFIDELLGC